MLNESKLDSQVCPARVVKLLPMCSIPSGPSLRRRSSRQRRMSVNDYIPYNHYQLQLTYLIAILCRWRAVTVSSELENQTYQRYRVSTGCFDDKPKVWDYSRRQLRWTRGHGLYNKFSECNLQFSQHYLRLQAVLLLIQNRGKGHRWLALSIGAGNERCGAMMS